MNFHANSYVTGPKSNN